MSSFSRTIYVAPASEAVIRSEWGVDRAPLPVKVIRDASDEPEVYVYEASQHNELSVAVQGVLRSVLQQADMAAADDQERLAWSCAQMRSLEKILEAQSPFIEDVSGA